MLKLMLMQAKSDPKFCGFCPMRRDSNFVVFVLDFVVFVLDFEGNYLKSLNRFYLLY